MCNGVVQFSGPVIILSEIKAVLLSGANSCNNATQNYFEEFEMWKSFLDKILLELTHRLIIHKLLTIQSKCNCIDTDQNFEL